MKNLTIEEEFKQLPLEQRVEILFNAIRYSRERKNNDSWLYYALGYEPFVGGVWKKKEKKSTPIEEIDYSTSNNDERRYDNTKFTPPFRVGRKQGKAILDVNGNMVVFVEGGETQAKLYCDYLNSHQQTTTEDFQADIRNKLSSPSNLCAMLTDLLDNEKDEEIKEMLGSEVEQTLKSIEYLSNLKTNNDCVVSDVNIKNELINWLSEEVPLDEAKESIDNATINKITAFKIEYDDNVMDVVEFLNGGSVFHLNPRN